MTLLEFYEKTGGNYEEVMHRLPGEAFVKKFLRRFSTDPSFETLKKAVETGDAEEVFQAAHTLKGVCQNLELGDLQRSVSELTECVRGGEFGNAAQLFEPVASDYKKVSMALEELED